MNLEEEAKLSMLSVSNLTKSFDSKSIFSNIDFNLNRGEIVSLEGPSGSGKSTLLKCLNLIEEADAGSITIDKATYEYRDAKANTKAAKRTANALRKNIGFVLQNFGLWTHLTVLENIILAPMNVLGLTKKEATAEAEKLLSEFDLYEKRYHYPNTLSGGQQQRIAIIRALIMKPKILLFDEPTSALDHKMVSRFSAIINNIVDEQGLSIMLSTHDRSFAQQVAHRRYRLEGGQLHLS